ncbi:MAG: MFS transporter, partial [Flavobacteriaceae bacterium]|nr:MFS transporter [Flavobacteriaceae bacterium]
MLNKTYRIYKDSFTGLSPEIWWLALITFINRAGTMVIPFLTLYLTKHLEFTLSEVGWVMSSFGIGSFLGSWLGGKLTDKIGYYKVMFWSLLLTGFLFITLQYVTSFWGFVVGVFITMTVADTFRPAIFVSLNAYSKPENQTRSLTLIRL